MDPVAFVTAVVEMMEGGPSVISNGSRSMMASLMSGRRTAKSREPLWRTGRRGGEGVEAMGGWFVGVEGGSEVEWRMKTSRVATSWA